MKTHPIGSILYEQASLWQIARDCGDKRSRKFDDVTFKIVGMYIKDTTYEHLPLIVLMAFDMFGEGGIQQSKTGI